MLIHPTLEKLSALRLSGMHTAFQEYLKQPEENLSFEERFTFLVEREYLHRQNQRLTRRLHQAKLKQSACIEDINFKHPRGLQKSSVLQLTTCEWIKNHLNIFITGPTGTGKTFLACALAHKACLMDFTARYYRIPRLFQELHVARADGTYPRVLSQLSKIDVLILDDWALAPLNDLQRRDLLELIDDRYQIRSTLITSQLAIEHWHDSIGDPTLADAILDRLLHHAIRLPLRGDSLRKHSSEVPPAELSDCKKEGGKK